jgi:hypothetical protein
MSFLISMSFVAAFLATFSVAAWAQGQAPSLPITLSPILPTMHNCMYNGRADACITIHRINCEVSKVEEACKYYEFGRNCLIVDADNCGL